MNQTSTVENGPVNELSISLVNAANVPSEDLGKKGAERAHVRYLLDERQGSDRFALRLYTILKGGHTPLDQHKYEHHVYVLSGQGLLRESKQPGAPLRPVKPKDAIFIPSNAVHQFSNIGDEPLVFLCVKGNPQLYSLRVAPDNSEQNYC